MDPTREGFSTEDAPIFEIYFRLEPGRDLLVGERLAQILFVVKAALNRRAQVDVISLDAVAPCLLGSIQRGVRV